MCSFLDVGDVAPREKFRKRRDRVRLRQFEARDRDWLIGAHMEHYGAQDGFDASFGTFVGEIIDAFLSDNDPARERGWVAEEDGDRLGSIFCVDAGGNVAKLRLFLVFEAARGKGLGRRLLEDCIGFARERGYDFLRLWTHESHVAACRLYEARGFSCLASKPVQSFGQDLVEQVWEMKLTAR